MNLDQYMRTHGISNRRASRDMQCNREQVSRWRRGLVRPDRDWWDVIVEWSGGAITEDVPQVRGHDE